MRLAIMSDTHMPRGTRALPAACVAELRAADAILHAGDFMRLEILRAIETLGPPVHGIHGNVDDDALRRAPGRPRGRGGRRADRDAPRRGPAHRSARADAGAFKDADAVVFGHSHLPLHERAPDGFQIFNPGSPTERRGAPEHTMGIATIEDGRPRLELLSL